MLLLTEESIPVVGDVVRRDAYDVSARLGAISGRMSVFRDLVSLTVPPKNVANLSAEPGSIYPDEDSPWKHIVPDKLRREQSINVVIPHE